MGTGAVLWSDWLAMVFVGIAVVMLLLAPVGLIAHRHYSPIRARGVGLLTLIALGGAVHTAATMVSNRHAPALTALELSCCVLWNYWLPYLGAGMWFTALYLRLYVYTAAVSQWCSARGARGWLRLRVPVALATAGSISLVCIAVTVDGRSRTDAQDGVCVSPVSYKVAVIGWAAMCTVVLTASLIVFRASAAADGYGEFTPIAVVAVLGVVVTVNQTVVLVFGYLAMPVTRAASTMSVALLYLWSFAMLGGKHLWHAMRGDEEYERIFDDNVEMMSQDLDDIITDASPIQGLTSDFIAYCEDPARKPVRIKLWFSVPAQLLAKSYLAMREWEVSMGEDETPLRSKQDICDAYMEESSDDYIGVPPDMVETARASDTPDALREVRTWVIQLLSDKFGRNYLNCDLYTRSFYPTIRIALDSHRRVKGMERLYEAGIVGARRKQMFEWPANILLES